ncbi:MAG: class I SAM-dependent methyltransferase [Thermoflavifilum sp.]|nr:class I SAM-dependent methyltransferase [Thermoflavifilum sp.]
MHVDFYWQYVRHMLHAKSRYQVHSPWVYQLIEEVLRRPYADPALSTVEALRRHLLHDHRLIEVDDPGAGSNMLSGRYRRMSQIARTAAKPVPLARMLFHLCRFLQPAMVIELGTSLGLTTAYLATAVPHATVITVEGSKAVAAEARKHFQQLGLSNVHLREGLFADVLPEIVASLRKPFLLFVDGDHRYHSTRQYVEPFLSLLGEGSCLVIDDIHWSPGMQRVWDELHHDRRINLSIDIFFLGLLFRQAGRWEAEHFSLRYPSILSWLI